VRVENPLPPAANRLRAVTGKRPRDGLIFCNLVACPPATGSGLPSPPSVVENMVFNHAVSDPAVAEPADTCESGTGSHAFRTQRRRQPQLTQGGWPRKTVTSHLQALPFKSPQPPNLPSFANRWGTCEFWKDGHPRGLGAVATGLIFTRGPSSRNCSRESVSPTGSMTG